MNRPCTVVLMAAALASLPACSKKAKSSCETVCERMAGCGTGPVAEECPKVCSRLSAEAVEPMIRCAGTTACDELQSCLRPHRAADAGIAQPAPGNPGWDTMALFQFDKAKFTTHGTIQVPPGSMVKDERTHLNDGTDHGAMLTVLLPTGQHVLLMERGDKAAEDPGMLKQVFGASVRVERKGPTWFVLGMDQGDPGKLALQGESWAVRPGLGCGVQEPVDPETFEVVVKICSSLAAP